MSRKTVRSKCRVSRQPPASGRKPSLKLPAQAIEASAEELITFHRLFRACFQRREQRQWSLFYRCGQLSNVERKTIETMVLVLHGAKANAVRDLQRFMIEEEAYPLRDSLAILHYRQCRNHAAYRSHRKRTIKQLHRHPKPRKRKTSK